MIINEIFYSIQGEGLLTGVPSVFIRLAGCPLRCRWCDTKYAQAPASGDDLTIKRIISKIKQWKCRHIVITGGEPFANPQLPLLAKALKKTGKHITIETAGLKFMPNLACDLMSISPKTSNSGLKFKKVTKPYTPIKRLIKNYPYQLKFVIESPRDLREIQRAVKYLGKVEPSRVLLMPQARTRDELLTCSPMVVELCQKTGFTFCTRLQLLLFDSQRGK
jgi:7-carboxy-7-deazaguanine synthase